MPDTDTVMNWSLSTPNNGLQTSAHSGTNAWGSNLYGQSLGLFEYESTFLYSPAIDLSGLSQATLTFWHCFDFNLTTSFEEGQVLICTNTSADPNSLPLLYDFSYATSDDWTQANLDLSAYVGKTIQVVWDYAGYDIGGPMYGWLVDDVSITGIAAGSGGLQEREGRDEGPHLPWGSGWFDLVEYRACFDPNVPPLPHPILHLLRRSWGLFCREYVGGSVEGAQTSC